MRHPGQRSGNEGDIILASGHLSIKEIVPLVKEARDVGVKRILINHPEYIVNGSVSAQKGLAQMGAYIEHILLSMMPMWFRKIQRKSFEWLKRWALSIRSYPLISGKFTIPSLMRERGCLSE